MFEDHTKMEAIRCLKCYIVREVCNAINRQSELLDSS